jgi:hypothetical protein
VFSLQRPQARNRQQAQAVPARCSPSCVQEAQALEPNTTTKRLATAGCILHARRRHAEWAGIPIARWRNRAISAISCS